MKFILFILVGIVGVNVYNYNNNCNIIVDLIYKPHNSPVVDVTPKEVKIGNAISNKPKQSRNTNYKTSPVREDFCNEVEYDLLDLSSLDRRRLWKSFNYSKESIELQLVDTMSISSKLLVVLADCEGFTPIPKKCGGNFAIGFGHAVKNSEIQHYILNPISKEEAYRILVKDASDKAIDIRKHYSGRTMTQGQFDALVSLCYSTGYGNFKKKSVSKLTLSNQSITKDDFVNTISSEYKIKYPGLIKRRLIEYLMYNNIYIYINKHDFKP